MDPSVIAGLKGAGTLLSFAAQLRSASAFDAQGKAIQQGAEFEARQLETKAGQERASSQRKMLAERKKERLVQSSLQARAAASGAGATDPTVNLISGDIAEEGELRALTALYEGEEAARGLESGAAVRRYEGDLARITGRIKKRAAQTTAFGTLLEGFSGAGSLYKKYNDLDLEERRSTLYG